MTDVHARRASAPALAAAVAAAYLAMMLGVAALADRGSAPHASIFGLALLGLVHFGVGALVARWWALLLPLAAIAIAATFGDPNSPPDAEVQVWLGLAVRSPLLIGLTAVGVLIGRVLLAPSSRHS